MRYLRTYHGGWFCEACQQYIPMNQQSFQEYFYDHQAFCPCCYWPTDLWKYVVNCIKDESEAFVLGCLGARWTYFELNVRLHQAHVLTFRGHDIPIDSQILAVLYIPVDQEKGTKLHLLEQPPSSFYHHSITDDITLYPVAIEDDPPLEAEFRVNVVWVKRDLDDIPWQSLTDSFQLYTSRQLARSLIPANVAVESTLHRIMTRFFEGVAARKYVKPFLQDGATYSNQLNILLPSLLSFTEAPALPDHIRGLLNRLRDVRNDIAHRGTLSNVLEKDEVAQCLAAALFGFHYLKIVEPLLTVNRIAPQREWSS